MEKIYLITAFEKMESKDVFGHLQMGCCRSIGYFKNFIQAEESLKYNLCDIWETVYDYAVIEEIDEGIYPLAVNKWFYEYSIASNGYRKLLSVPEDYENAFNLGGIC